MEEKRYQNFVSCYRGLSYVGKALLPYTESVLNKVFQEAYKHLTGLPPCTKRCSKTYGNRTKDWCKTCKKWKNVLLKNRKPADKINWQETKSWTWPKAMENIIEVFMPSWYAYDLRDIPTASLVWKEVKMFKVNRTIYKTVCNMRHKYYGHNPDLEVSDLNKSKLFDALNDLINDPDVKKYIDTSRCTNYLKSLQSSHFYIGSMGTISVSTDTGADIGELIMRQIDENELTKKANTSPRVLKRANANISIPIILLMCYLTYFVLKEDILTGIGRLMQKEINGYKQTECVSEEYAYPFPQDLPLLPYILNHKKLFGREWLFQEIESKILTDKQGLHGVSIIADIGYGKTALFSNMLCAEENTKGWYLKQRVAAFHICKFDVPSTMKLVRFIRRLIGFFSTYNAEFGNIISLLSNESLIFNYEMCEREPIACFDQGILFPLEKMSSFKTWIIAIDALDECSDPETQQNHIFNLLNDRMRKFPPWVKFLITSRNTTKMSNLKTIDIMRLRVNDKRNLRDLKSYVTSQAIISNNTRTDKDRVKWIKDRLEKSEGNFLFVVSTMEMHLGEKDQKKQAVPSKLTDIYEINFTRQFKNEFNYAKLIFEILSASLSPLTEAEIINVLKMNGYKDERKIGASFEKLLFFLRIDTDVTFIHKSVRDWLTTEDHPFRIRKENGHSLLAQYQMQRNHRIDFVDLAIHIGKSKKKKLLEQFSSFRSNNLIVDSDSLHVLMAKTSSYEAFKAALLHFNYTDIPNNSGATPAFMAASKGYTRHLKLLIGKGSNHSFAMQPYGQAHIKNVVSNIQLIKTTLLSGYNLLHIAVTFNRVKTVTYLLKLNNSLAYLENEIGYLPSDIACEKGYSRILKQIIIHAENTVLGEKCLYLATKNNHINILDFFSGGRFDFGCLSDEVSLKYFNQAFELEPGHRLIYSSGIVLPRDEWWIIMKENALHIAVKMGHYSIVRKLVKLFPKMLNCRDGLGRTPFLNSIWYNQTEMFIFLSDMLNSEFEVCSFNFPEHMFRFIDVLTFLDYSKEDICLPETTFQHITARFDRIEMINYVLENNIRMNWSVSDEEGNTPDHYAAIFGSVNYLNLRIQGPFTNGVDNTILLQKESVICTAVSYGQNAVLHILTNLEDQMSMSQYIDEENRSIMLHSVIRRNVNTSSVIQSRHVEVVRFLVEKGHSLSQKDIYDRNILHYALSNGYRGIVEYIFKSDQPIWKKLIQDKDILGRTPIEHSLFNNIEQSRTSFEIPGSVYLCTVGDIFLGHCKDLDQDSIMFPWERALTVAFQLSHESQASCKVPDHLISSIFVKSPYLTTAMVLYLNVSESVLYRELCKTINILIEKNDIFQHSFTSLNAFKPNSIHVCYQNFKASPLHRMAFYIQSKYNPLVSEFIQLNRLHKDILCSDARGYNIFHYALLGGNIMTAKRIYNIHGRGKNMRFGRIPWLVVMSRVRDADNYNLCLDTIFGPHYKFNQNVDVSQIRCSDNFLSELIKSHVSYFGKAHICSNGTTELSLIHLLSINGFMQTIQAIIDIHGIAMMYCVTKDGFSTRYMLKLFTAESDLNKFDGSMSNVIYPNPVAEEILMFKFHTYPSPLYSTDPLKCLFELRTIHWRLRNIRYRYKLKSCMVDSFVYTIRWSIIAKQIEELKLPFLFKKILKYTFNIDIFLKDKIIKCSLLRHAVNKHVYFMQFISLYSERFADRSPLIQYLSQEIPSLYSQSFCPMSEHIRLKLCNLQSACNALISKVLPQITRMYSQFVFSAMKIDGRSVEGSSFLQDRMDRFRFGRNHDNHGVDFNVMDTYSEFKYLDVIKRTVMYNILNQNSQVHPANISISIFAKTQRRLYQSLLQILVNRTT